MHSCLTGARADALPPADRIELLRLADRDGRLPGVVPREPRPHASSSGRGGTIREAQVLSGSPPRDGPALGPR